VISGLRPFTVQYAFLVAQGLETLSDRVERHVAKAQKVARVLARCTLGGVGDSRACHVAWYELGKKRAQGKPVAVLASSWRRHRRGSSAFVNRADGHRMSQHRCERARLVIHPASTTQGSASLRRSQLANGVPTRAGDGSAVDEVIDRIGPTGSRGFAGQPRPLSASGQDGPDTRRRTECRFFDVRYCDTALPRRGGCSRHRRTEDLAFGERPRRDDPHDAVQRVGRTVPIAPRGRSAASADPAHLAHPRARGLVRRPEVVGQASSRRPRCARMRHRRWWAIRHERDLRGRG